MKTEKKYEEVQAELEKLVARIEDPERDLATIGGDVKKAKELIRWCRNYLAGTQADVEKLMKEED